MTSPTSSSAGLTLAHLLHPPTWDLPGWNGSRSEGLHGTVDKLGDFDHSLALLQRYRNGLRPVHQLATDILLLIFMSLTEEEDADPFHSRFGSNPWSSMTQVCHRWRSIALACPTLWTRISTRWPDAALTCLERSADAPLSLVVSANASAQTASRVTGFMLPHAGRIRQIYLPAVFRDAAMAVVLGPLLLSPAPGLDALHVYKVAMDDDCFPLPTMFDGQTPRLRTLKLRYTFPIAGSVMYTNLRKLLIKGKKSKPISMELSQLLAILELCPQLEALKIEKANVIPSSTALRPVSLRLDNLQLLDIARSSATVVSDLLNCLVVPDCAIRLRVWLERAADFTFRFGIPETLNESRHLENIRGLHVEYVSSSGFVVIQGRTTANPFEIMASIPRDSDMGEMSTIAGHLLLSIVRTLDLSFLEVFTISETHYNHAHLGFTRQRWVEVFERMPLLKVLHIRLDSIYDGGFARSILSALATPREITGRLLCPHLETLTVVNDKTWSSLHCYLLAQERAKHGHPLKKVSMHMPCYENFEDIDDTDLPALRRVIDVVDLDPPTLCEYEIPDISW